MGFMAYFSSFFPGCYSCFALQIHILEAAVLSLWYLGKFALLMVIEFLLLLLLLLCLVSSVSRLLKIEAHTNFLSQLFQDCKPKSQLLLFPVVAATPDSQIVLHSIDLYFEL